MVYLWLIRRRLRNVLSPFDCQVRYSMAAERLALNRVVFWNDATNFAPLPGAFRPSTSRATPPFSRALPSERPFFLKTTVPVGVSAGSPSAVTVATRMYLVRPSAWGWVVMLRFVTVGAAPTVCLKTVLTDPKSSTVPL